jgi:nitroreductase
MDVIEAIQNRRSVREFREKDIPTDKIEKILEAGRWAPSGLNNQPWKFMIIKNLKLKENLASYTHYGKIIINAPVCIAVFLDGKVGYDRTKDVQAIGACIQNMLLAVHSLGLGAVWLGEILNNRKDAENILNAREGCELMAVLAIGTPTEKKRSSTRKKVEGLML